MMIANRRRSIAWAGLVTTRREGSSVYYAIKDPLVVDLLATAKALLLTSLRETQDLLAGLSDDTR